MYTYPDKNDLLTCELIEREYDGAYWGASEDNLLKNVQVKIDRRKGEKKMLDVGCGMGRLFPVFLPHVDTIKALEPDEARFAQAQRTAEDFDGRIEVLRGDVRLLEDDEQYSVVLISHILQHIKDADMQAMLNKLKKVTAGGGMVIVTTTHAEGDDNLYFAESWEDGRRKTETISKEEFDTVFEKEGVLPVRLFAEKNIVETFKAAGFILEEKKYYHYKDHHRVEEDIEKNNAGDGRDARDILYIFRREQESMDANITYSFSFSYFKRDRIDQVEISPDTLFERVKEKHPGCISADSKEAENVAFFRDIKIAQGFLHGGGLPFNNFRMYFGEYDLSMEDAEIKETTAYMTLFPEASIAQVDVSLSLKNCTNDFLVYMRHVQGNGRKLKNKDGRMLSVKDIYGEISESLKCSITDMEETYLLEITKYDEYQLASDVFENEKRPLYGMMCGDEGYRTVPEALCDERLSNSWGSREFIRLATFGANTIFVNLNQGALAKGYLENRKRFDASYYGDVNPYFLIDSPVAGVNHGLIFSLELVMVIKTISNRILSRQSEYYHPDHGLMSNLGMEIRKTRSYRSELITTLKKVENLSISEIGEMEVVFLKGQQIEPLIEKIKYLLELLESELDLLYQSSTNRLVNILTVAGLVLSVIGLIINGLAL